MCTSSLRRKDGLLIGNHNGRGEGRHMRHMPYTSKMRNENKVSIPYPRMAIKVAEFVFAKPLFYEEHPTFHKFRLKETKA